MILAYAGLRYARVVGHVLGEAGSRAIGKVASVFLAAFGVSLVRRGLPGFVSQ
jgi:small neutral amino acid transporter SnatA (MarC family)